MTKKKKVQEFPEEGHLGMDCDRAEWLKFRETVRMEIKRREEHHV